MSQSLNLIVDGFYLFLMRFCYRVAKDEDEDVFGFVDKDGNFVEVKKLVPKKTVKSNKLKKIKNNREYETIVYDDDGDFSDIEIDHIV